MGDILVVADNMVENVKTISALVATGRGFTVVVVIVVGALQALGSMVRTFIDRKTLILPLMVFEVSLGGWFWL